jgi:transcriptional regulator with GAF, ATPase, and Fis domain
MSSCWSSISFREFAERHGKSIDHIPNEVMEVLESYGWPGNIRELQNFIERAHITATLRETSAGGMVPPPRLGITADGIQAREGRNLSRGATARSVVLPSGMAGMISLTPGPLTEDRQPMSQNMQTLSKVQRRHSGMGSA